MKGRITGLALALGAIILLGGAVLLLRSGDNETVEQRGNVTAPPEAPAWTVNGQQAKPDYSSSNATAEVDNATDQETEQVVPVVKESKAPRVVEEDPVVTVGFLDAAARTLVEGFIPGRFSTSGNPATNLSFRTLNMRFGRSLEGFNVKGSDSAKARAALFEYLLTPGLAEGLFKDYEPVFIDRVEDTARMASPTAPEGETYSLTVPEISDMFRLYAKGLRNTSKAFRATADPHIAETVARYIRAARSAERANAAFQTAMADYGVGAKEVTVAGSRLKGAVKERGRIKKIVVDSMREHCSECSTEELFYIATWSYRRSMESDRAPEFLEVMADSLANLADGFDARSAKLLEE